MSNKIWLSSPHMGGNEQHYVNQAFEDNWIAPIGPQLDLFEQKISEAASHANVAALSSGTAALHLAMILADVKPGDFVICQSLTFSASANPIRYQGAIPVFIDSEPDTWNLCPNAMEEAIQACIDGSIFDKFPEIKKLSPDHKGKKPKAIVPVHLYGMPAKMNEILAVANKYQIPIIEDSAEALGSFYQNIPCGTFGEFGVFSFNGNKIITTSGGGALISQNKQLIERAKYLSTQARMPAPHYQHEDIGYNYRLSNVSAAIGIGQMEVLSERVRQRRNNFQIYQEHLGVLPGFEFIEESDGFFSNRWLSTVLIHPEKANGVDREKVRLALESENIESRPIWKPMHLQPVFRGFPYFGDEKIAEMIFENGLCLPSGSNLSKDDLLKTINFIKKMIVNES